MSSPQQFRGIEVTGGPSEWVWFNLQWAGAGHRGSAQGLIEGRTHNGYQGATLVTINVTSQHCVRVPVPSDSAQPQKYTAYKAAVSYIQFYVNEFTLFGNKSIAWFDL